MAVISFIIQAPGLFHPIPIFSSKAGAFPSGTPFEFHSKSRLMALSTNVRLGRKLLTLASTLAYYDSTRNTPVKKFYRTGTSIVLLEVITMSGSSKLLPETILYFVFRSLATRLWIQTAFRLNVKWANIEGKIERRTNGRTDWQMDGYIDRQRDRQI